MDTIETVVDRIVKKNELLWKLMTDHSLNHDEQLKIVDELFSKNGVHDLKTQ